MKTPNRFALPADHPIQKLKSDMLPDITAEIVGQIEAVTGVPYPFKKIGGLMPLLICGFEYGKLHGQGKLGAASSAGPGTASAATPATIPIPRDLAPSTVKVLASLPPFAVPTMALPSKPKTPPPEMVACMAIFPAEMIKRWAENAKNEAGLFRQARRAAHTLGLRIKGCDLESEFGPLPEKIGYEYRQQQRLVDEALTLTK